MKILLSVIAISLFLLGLGSLTLPYALVLSIFIGDFEPSLLLFVLPIFLIAIACLKYSVTYLIKRDEKTANRLAIIAGIAVWVILNTEVMEYDEFLVTAENDYGFSLADLLLFLPIFIGIIVTKLLKRGIKKTFSNQNSEQGVVADAKSATTL